MPSSEDIAWAAGFYEGEGSCTNVNSRRLGKGRGTICAVISQTNLEPLERIVSLFGGGVCETNAYKSNKNWNLAYRWSVGGSGAKKFFNAIYPQLSKKRRMRILKAFMDAPVPRARPGLKKDTEEYRAINAARERVARAKGLR